MELLNIVAWWRNTLTPFQQPWQQMSHHRHRNVLFSAFCSQNEQPQHCRDVKRTHWSHSWTHSKCFTSHQHTKGVSFAKNMHLVKGHSLQHMNRFVQLSAAMISAFHCDPRSRMGRATALSLQFVVHVYAQDHDGKQNSLTTRRILRNWWFVWENTQRPQTHNDLTGTWKEMFPLLLPYCLVREETTFTDGADGSFAMRCSSFSMLLSLRDISNVHARTSRNN